MADDALQEQIVHVGVLTKGNLAQTMQMWPLTIEEYLSSQIPGTRFEMIPLGFKEIGPAVGRADVDFVLTNPASYVELETHYNIGRIATLKHRWTDTISSDRFGGVIFTRSDHPEVYQLKDLVGTRFVAVNERAFGGWAMAWRELKHAGITPASDFSELKFAGSHQAVIRAVLNGEADAGTVRTGELERMARNGDIMLSMIRALPTKALMRDAVNPTFPFLRSTRLYPEWPFAKLKHTDPRLAERVAVALMNMPANSDAAKAADSAGWTVPLNYQAVRELMQELRVGTYAGIAAPTPTTVFRYYPHWIIFTLVALGLMGLVTGYVLKLNRRISVAKKIAENEARERAKSESVLKQSEERFRSLVETTSDFAWEIDSTGRYSYVSPQVRHLLGHEPKALLGKDLGALICSGHAPHQTNPLAACLEKQTSFNAVETLQRHKAGHLVVLECSGVPFFDQKGVFLGFRGINRDITPRRLTEEALHHEKERAHVTLESIADGVIRTDTKGIIEYINPAGIKLTGWDVDAAVGKPLLTVLNLVDETSGQQIRTPLARTLMEGGEIRLTGNTLLLQHDSEKNFHVELNITPLRDPEDEIIGAVLVFHDISEIRRLTQQITYQASHDALTELLNRREFERRLERALEHAKSKEASHVLCYLDLDQFKMINDSSGHAAGDALLKQIASRLSLAIRETDVLARLGSDEFGILLSDCQTKQATTIIKKLLKGLRDYRFAWQGKVFQVGVSAGLAEINATSGSLTDILSAADSACYVAKEQGRNGVHWFQPGDAAVALRHGQLQWIHKIKRALDEDRFRLACEAFVPLSVSASEVSHYEILLRMVDEDGKSVSPMEFIPAAERYHLMPAIDKWVITTAFRALAAKQRETTRDVVYAINLSGQSLSDEEFLGFTINQFEISGVAPECICFEITETAAIANLARASRLMSILKGMGCRFALDDFGSGLSSFAYLKSLPVDYLKIDGSFVQNLLNDRIDFAMVDSINQIGQLMGLTTIAECVENDETLDKVRALGIDYAQGHHIAEVAPLDTSENQLLNMRLA